MLYFSCPTTGICAKNFYSTQKREASNKSTLTGARCQALLSRFCSDFSPAAIAETPSQKVDHPLFNGHRQCNARRQHGSVHPTERELRFLQQEFMIGILDNDVKCSTHMAISRFSSSTDRKTVPTERSTDRTRQTSDFRPLTNHNEEEQVRDSILHSYFTVGLVSLCSGAAASAADTLRPQVFLQHVQPRCQLIARARLQEPE